MGEYLGHNIFAFCANSPNMFVDQDGYVWAAVLHLLFLVNNWEILADILRDIDRTGIELVDTEVEKSQWFIPKMQDYKKHNGSKTCTILEKNVFVGYGTDILVQPNRSQPEIAFEQWCEINDNVEWVYKNGDKGRDFFTVIYRVAFRRYNFYPDFIIRLKNGETWIIETKGGAAADGTSTNIDTYAAQKFDALKEYGEKHSNIKWGFVRNLGAQLYISNTVWDENLMNHDVWKPIKSIFE